VLFFVSYVRLVLLKYLYKDCSYRDVEQRTTTDMAWKAFARFGMNERVPDHTIISKWTT